METDNTARLFPGFEDRWIDLESTRIFTRTGGPDGAPVVLLIHGFPQSHLCWHPIAADLAKTHRVVCLDLKGYGRSATPSGDRAHREYSKRMWARECVAAMSELGHDRFAVVGHDRGAQVAYRMALDSPERIGKLAILDNLPIHIVWELIDANPGYLPWWEMMARPAPEPENIMTADYIEELVAGASATQSVDIFHPAVLEEYRRNWADPSHVHAYCEDYRAGAGPDVIADKDDIDAGRRIECPVLVLCSKLVFGKADEQPVDVWRRTFAPDVRGKLLDCGHFLTEEKPEETLAELSGFLDSADGKAS